MIKEWMQKYDITIINIYASNRRTSKYMKVAYAKTWMDLEDNILSEMSTTKGNILYDYPSIR